MESGRTGRNPLEGLTLGTGPESVSLRGLLGRGGWGAVYEAVWCRDGRTVAVKVLGAAVDGLTLDDESLGRFADERSAALRVRHPGLVSTLGAGVDPRCGPYTVHELLPGESLRHVLSRGALPLAETLAVAQAVLPALEALHGVGVVHRDVKPDNVLRAADGSWKLGDFGLALFEGRAARTKTGVVVGTPGYVAPEAFGGVRGDVGRAADVYGAAVLLVECLTGCLPFRGGTPLEILRSQMGEAPTAAGLVVLGLPEPLAGVLAPCLHKDPAHRPASVQELLVQVEEAGRRVSPDWRPAGAAAGSGRVTVRAVGAREPVVRRISTGVLRFLERRRRLAVLVTGLFVLVLAGRWWADCRRVEVEPRAEAGLAVILDALVMAGDTARPWPVDQTTRLLAWLDGTAPAPEGLSLRHLRRVLPAEGPHLLLLEHLSRGRPLWGAGAVATLARALQAAGRALAIAGPAASPGHLELPLWLCRRLASSMAAGPPTGSSSSEVLAATDAVEAGLSELDGPALRGADERRLVVALELLRALVASGRAFGDETLALPALRRAARSVAGDASWLVETVDLIPERVEFRPRAVPTILPGGLAGAELLEPPPADATLDVSRRGILGAVSELRNLSEAFTRDLVRQDADVVARRRLSGAAYGRLLQAWWWTLWGAVRADPDRVELDGLLRFTLDLPAYLEGWGEVGDRPADAWADSSLGARRSLGRAALMMVEYLDSARDVRGLPAQHVRFLACRGTLKWLDEAVRVGLVETKAALPPMARRSTDPVVRRCVEVWSLLRTGRHDSAASAYGALLEELLSVAKTAPSASPDRPEPPETQLAAWAGWHLGPSVLDRSSVVEAPQRALEDWLCERLGGALPDSVADFYAHGWDRLMGQAIQRAVGANDRERLLVVRRSIDAVGRGQPDPRFRERGAILVSRIDRYADSP